MSDYYVYWGSSVRERAQALVSSSAAQIEGEPPYEKAGLEYYALAPILLQRVCDLIRWDEHLAINHVRSRSH